MTGWYALTPLHTVVLLLVKLQHPPRLHYVLPAAPLFVLLAPTPHPRPQPLPNPAPPHAVP